MDVEKAIFGKTQFQVLLTNLNKNIYSPRLHQNLYQKIINELIKYIPIKIKPRIFNEEDIDLLTDETVNDKHLEKSNRVIETYEGIEE